MKYKVGDKVRVRKDLNHCCEYGGSTWDGDHAGCEGVIRFVSFQYYNINFTDGTIDDMTRWTDEMLEPAVKTLKDLEVGDVVYNGNARRKIVAVTGLLYGVSYHEEYNTFYVFYTLEDLKKYGYKIEQEEVVNDTIELTMDEIADKFGVDVKKLKIKKD